ncbi:MAG: DUF192 domain-containing protein [Filomicrobium sp.]
MAFSRPVASRLSTKRSAARTNASIAKRDFSRAVTAALFSSVIAVCIGSLGPSPVAAEPSGQVAKLEKLSITKVTGGAPIEFQIEVARTQRQKALGLMFRRSLAPNRGMLFPYPSEQTVTMWMKNTYIPLDMLFIKADGRIHRIEAMTEPFSEKIISSGADVSAVLEIAGGEARRLGIGPGDKVSHGHFK